MEKNCYQCENCGSVLSSKKAIIQHITEFHAFDKFDRESVKVESKMSKKNSSYCRTETFSEFSEFQSSDNDLDLVDEKPDLKSLDDSASLDSSTIIGSHIKKEPLEFETYRDIFESKTTVFEQPGEIDSANKLDKKLTKTESKELKYPLAQDLHSKSESVKIHTLSMRKSSHFKELIKFHT